MPKKFSSRLYFALLYALPAVLFFSFYPVISLGSNASMNFELSLPLLWLVTFDLTAFAVLFTIAHTAQEGHSTLKRERLGSSTEAMSQEGRLRFSSNLPEVASNGERLDSSQGAPEATAEDADARPPRRRADATSCPKRNHKRSHLVVNFPGISDRRIFLTTLFPFYCTLSAFWSPNPLRALLTAAIIWLLWFAVFSILYVTPLISARRRKWGTKLLRVFFVSTALVCLFCFIQSFLDIFGVSRDTTLLCAGCTYRSFGFPHPSGFAIEPQFMGNLLLAPTLLTLFLLVEKPVENSAKKWLIAFALLFMVTLFFTFSRGAIYAFAVGLAILLISVIIRRRTTSCVTLLVIPAISFVAALCLQGTFAAVGPTSETFHSAVTKSIHHLSLGLIDFRPIEKPSAPESANTSADILDGTPESALFGGYVAESTNVRLGLNGAALAVWRSSPGNFFFGVGLGGAGSSLYSSGLTGSPKEVIQNEPLSILLELGLVGLLLVVFELLVLLTPQIFPRRFLDGKSAPHSPAHTPVISPLLLALGVAYIVSLQFFSGLPNALHIYLLPPLLYVVLLNKPQKLLPKSA